MRSVFVSTVCVTVVWIGAIASSLIIPFTLSGIIRMASHRPPVSARALEGGSALLGARMRPPNLMCAIAESLCMMCPTPPYDIRSWFVGVLPLSAVVSEPSVFITTVKSVVSVLVCTMCPSSAALVILYGQTTCGVGMVCRVGFGCSIISGLSVFGVFLVPVGSLCTLLGSLCNTGSHMCLDSISPRARASNPVAACCVGMRWPQHGVC